MENNKDFKFLDEFMTKKEAVIDFHGNEMKVRKLTFVEEQSMSNPLIETFGVDKATEFNEMISKLKDEDSSDEEITFKMSEALGDDYPVYMDCIEKSLIRNIALATGMGMDRASGLKSLYLYELTSLIDNALKYDDEVKKN